MSNQQIPDWTASSCVPGGMTSLFQSTDLSGLYQAQAAQQMSELQHFTRIAAQQTPAPVKPQEKKTMFGEIKSDVTKFVSEYRYIFYFIALALLVDQFLFRGVFRERLQSMMDKMVTKIEQKIAA
jgi:hypothetical protein